MRGSYPDAWFLSRTRAGGLTPPIDGGTHATVSVLSTTPAHTTYPHARVRDHDLQRMITLRTVLLHCEATNHAAHAPHTAHAWSRTHAPLASRAPRAAAPGPHHPRAHSAHTKRARTNRSGRATYSAQALGRLPWFAPFLRRSRRLRPRFDMSFSLGLLSRLKHFCTHWSKPPRHRPFAATKVTEKRAATPTSSAHAARRDHALSQRS